MQKIIIFLLFSILSSSAVCASNFSQEEKTIYYNTENYIDKKFNIDKYLIRSIVETESKFNKYAVNLFVKKQSKIINFLTKHQIKYTISSKSRIGVYPQNKAKANTFYSNIIEHQNYKKYSILDFDLGLMQINRLNFDAYSLDKTFYLDYVNNMLVGASILRTCFEWSSKKFRNSSSKVIAAFAIECYNKGTRPTFIEYKNYNYYSKVVRAYINIKHNNKREN